MLSNDFITGYDKKNSSEIIQLFDLQTHPEGGYFKEIARVENEENNFTKILFLLTKDTNDKNTCHFKSNWHRLSYSDEYWHFEIGQPINLYWIEGINIKRQKLGNGSDCKLNQIVSAQHWMGAELEYCGTALVSCVCVPAFDYSEFQVINRNNLKFDENLETVKKTYPKLFSNLLPQNF